MAMQDEVSEPQRELITANWGKLNLSRKGVEQARATMVAALTAASQGSGNAHLTLSSRAVVSSQAVEQVRLAVEVRLHVHQLFSHIILAVRLSQAVEHV